MFRYFDAAIATPQQAQRYAYAAVACAGAICRRRRRRCRRVAVKRANALHGIDGIIAAKDTVFPSLRHYSFDTLLDDSAPLSRYDYHTPLLITPMPFSPLPIDFFETLDIASYADMLLVAMSIMLC